MSFINWKFLLIGAIAVVALYIAYAVTRGAINYDRLKVCKTAPPEQFCGIQEIDLAVPQAIKGDIMKCVKSGLGKRVVLDGWKAGRTISTADVKKELPELWRWYTGLEEQIGSVIGESVHITSDTLPTTCAVLVYEEDGDFINWHYDVNYFNGRFFTLLIPVTIENSCTLYTYYDKNNTVQNMETKDGKAILFEGNKTFHMATKFCNRGQKRVVVSVQFSTDPSISWYNRALMRIKDSAYIGIFA